MRRWLQVIAVAAALLLLVACGGSQAGAAASERPPEGTTTRQLRVLLYQFSGTRTFDLLRRQVAFGPRVPGTPAHQQCRDFIKQELSAYCDSVAEQSFPAVVNERKYEFFNVTGYIHPEAERVVILAAHYDTRPFADMDSPENYSTPIPGANDGASGVAVLLELARVLEPRLPDDIGVLFLFTDGEDTGRTARQMFQGARYFASTMSPDLRSRIVFGILLDMVGDASLGIRREKNSEAVAPGIFTAILELQDMLGLQGFLDAGERNVLDDHIPFIEQGVRMYDLIDIDYTHWHTLQDTVERCSAASLQVVGLCVANLVLNYADGSFSL